MKTNLRGILTLLLAFVVHLSFAQQKTITGKVVDPDGLPIPGVSIQIKGTQQGTQTDFDGNYSIEASSDQTLVFTYLGYEKQEVPVGGQSTINATLQQGAEALDEVVVTGYNGILKDSDVVSSVSTVNSESIEQVPIASADQLLQGTAAGTNVRQASGQPGAAATVIIRGRSSLTGDNDPLYVIDGVPVDQDNFRSLNANDIESMSVLKDASATAIYGNRASAGVVVITTKQADKNQDVQIKYSSLFGISDSPDTNINVMNANQYLNFQRDLLPGTQFADGLNDAEISAIAQQTNTNWADILLQQGQTESHQLTISSGTESLASYTSLQYFEQTGITLGSSLQRFSLRNNMNGGNDKIQYQTNVNLSYAVSDFTVDATRGGNTGGQLDNPFIVPFLGLPYLNAYNPDGTLNRVGTERSGALNPDGSINVGGANGFVNTPFIALNTAAFNTDVEKDLRVLASGKLRYQINDEFALSVNPGVDYVRTNTLQIDAPGTLRGLLNPNQDAAEEIASGRQFEGYFRDFTFNTFASLEYANTFDEKHDVSATLYTEYIYQNIQNGGFTAFGLNPKFPGSSSGFTDPATFFPAIDNPDGDPPAVPFAPSVFSQEIERALFSVFGNIRYSFDDKYGLDINIRRDGTSRFQDDVRWGTFISVGGRWNIDKEDFMDDVDWVSSLKLRGSYGETGNESAGGFFEGFQTVGGGAGYQNNNQLSVTNLVDENIQWETTTTTNVGVDFGFWKNKLTGSIDVYDEFTDGLFFDNNISPAATGYTSVRTNVAEMSNKGVELQLSYDILRKGPSSDWGVNVFFNGAYNKNEIESVANESGFTGVTARLQEGRPAFSWFDQRWAGVDPSNGQPLYLDAEGELTTQFDRNENGVYLDKQFDPFWTGGFGTNITWKNFRLRSLFSYAADTWRNNASLAIVEDPSLAGFANQRVSMLNAWTTPGQVTDVPGLQYGGLRAVDGDRYLEDASFLRLRNVTVEYSFDQETLDKVGFFKGIRIFVQGTNLITWSEWRGFDPETNELSDFFNYPSTVQLTTGIDVTF
jgi:TonB-linked SusC/RagA family outer membrane protein